MAVLLLDSCCARAARMTAIHVRIVAVYGDMIRMRCVARPRDTAVDIRAADNRRRYTRELVAFVGNFSDFAIIVLADIDVRLRPIRRLGLRRARVAREVDAAVVLQQGQRFHRRSRRRELRPVHLGRGAARQVQHRAMRGNAVHIEGDLLEADNVRGGIRARNIQRVARAVCLCAACNRTVYRCALKVDGIVVRDRTFAACDCARICLDGDGIARGFAACFAADNCARDRLVNRDLVARRLAICNVRKTAVDCAADRSCAIHRDLIGNAVAALIRRSLRACARRPAAVHVRMRAVSDGDAVPRRRIARNGAAAPCVRADGRRRRRPLEGVGIADNPSVPVANIEIRFLRPVCIQFGLEHVAAREGQRVRTLDEGRFVYRRIKTSLKGIEVECSRIRQRELRCGILERDLLEVLNSADACRRVDVQRIAVRRAVAAGDCARDRAARKRDGIIVRRAVRRRIAAVDVAKRPARDGDTVTVAVILVVLRRARAARMTAVDVRIVAVYGDMIRMRCVARLRDAAERFSPVDNRVRYTRELIALVADVRDIAARPMNGNVLFRRCVRLGFQNVIGRSKSVDRDAVRIVQERDAAVHGTACGVNRAPVERRPRAAVQVQHGRPRSDTRRIEVELLEVHNLPGTVHALDTEQIARAVFRAAVDILRHRRAVQMDFVAVCRPKTGRATVNSARSTYAVQVDLVVVYRRTAGGTSAIDIAAVIQCDTFVDRHYVVRCLAARHGRHTAIDIAADRGSAVDCDLVMRAVALVRCCSL